jgi:glycine/D-amino acid oxidase-like deaminating enzyme
MDIVEDSTARKGLARLAADARRDLARLNYPPANWVLPRMGADGQPALDVLVIGAGMCGQTAAFALMREGVGNLRILDRAPRGHEGPWGTYARMETLRSPKHLTGPDLGIPSLTFRAWYEAQHGAAGWRELYKVDRLDWLAYLLFVRDVAAIPVENNIEVRRLFPADDKLIGAEIVGPGGRQTR